MKLIHTILAIALFSATTVLAQTTTAATTATAPAETTTAAPLLGDRETARAEFDELLNKYPPEVGKMLKLSPALFANEKFMASYPALSAYVAQHPEITQSPSYYLRSVYIPGELSPEPASVRMTREMLEGVTIFAVMALIAAMLMWLIRTLIDYRRWSRLSRVQTEVHSKLLERFTSSQELLAYTQTPAGARFLESAPITLAEPPRALGAPVARVLWPLQIGVILIAGGIGLQFVAARVEKDVTNALFALSVLAISVGVGFAVSAVIAYAVSRKLGLWATVTPAAE
ncbi:MAG TPA: hypothetical protein VGF69_16930 [Thermoanaerobaculia bacterium]|jgi:hypothetical protein